MPIIPYEEDRPARVLEYIFKQLNRKLTFKYRVHLHCNYFKGLLFYTGDVLINNVIYISLKNYFCYFKLLQLREESNVLYFVNELVNAGRKVLQQWLVRSPDHGSLVLFLWSQTKKDKKIELANLVYELEVSNRKAKRSISNLQKP